MEPSGNGGAEAESKKFSLSLKSVSTKKSAFNKNLVQDADVKEETDFVTEVNNRAIKSTREPEKKKVFVIPALENDNVLRKKLKLKDGAEIEREIQQELFGEANQDIKQEPPSPDSDSPVIPKSTGNKLDFNLETQVEAPTMEAYEQMPIEEFGTALLRGMGWKPGQAIGARCSKAAKPIEVKLRPKGLGLGAEVQSSAQKEQMKQAKKLNDVKQPLIIKSGAFVKILRGTNEGKYGKVEGMDEDSGRVHVCLAISKEKVSCNEAFVAAVTSEEYNDRGKCLNREKYDDYKRKHEIAPQNNSKFDVDSLHLSGQQQSEQQRKQKEKQNDEKYEKRRPFIGYWLRSQIRVRIVDEKYKKGKYLNEKVVVEDVLSRDTCLCRTDQGKLLEDVHMDMLETVLPRSHCQSNVPVLVVAGKYAGQLGHIVERDKKQSQAYVQFEIDKNVHKLMFDYISEYVGDL